MANKKNFVLRIDEDVYAALEKWAADDFRSVNGQIEWVIHKQLKESSRLPSVKTNKTQSGKSDKRKT